MIEFLKSTNLWLSVGVALLALVVQFLLKRLEHRMMKAPRFPANGTTPLHVVNGVMRYGVLVLAVLFVLQINGVNVSSILTGLGVTGIIVGFALQDILKDVAMGVNILTRSFLRIGDVIEYAGSFWEVDDLSVRFLYLKNIDTQERFIVSNRNISEIRIQSDYQNLIIPGNYGIPAARMRPVCEEISRKVGQLPNVTRCDFHGIDRFEESQISYLLRVYSEPKYRDEVRRQANGVIQDILEQNRIDIPFNQLDVHLKKE